MRYASMAQMAEDSVLRGRLVACAAEQGKAPYPDGWVAERIWKIVVAPGWAEAWASALAAENPNPGLDPAVISDEMILALIQPMDAPASEPSEEMTE